ncbi:hypothetical protein BSR29_05375 [Boudabousia liubingyangii]|uniref:Uncharacterized protein n=1 Tax=Boudabousia liubingyangii TaxID=1921764 RepID=A0A1Q5PLJ4_9ACTO|nr:hypothetical protein [Boudabousia liubingyangii]OKL47916.1 hypothetical protein BSR29_05375 [Boudabousia liubingyangii]
MSDYIFLLLVGILAFMVLHIVETILLSAYKNIPKFITEINVLLIQFFLYVSLFHIRYEWNQAFIAALAAGIYLTILVATGYFLIPKETRNKLTGNKKK